MASGMSLARVSSAHSLVAQTPALAPLVLDRPRPTASIRPLRYRGRWRAVGVGRRRDAVAPVGRAALYPLRRTGPLRTQCVATLGAREPRVDAQHSLHLVKLHPGESFEAVDARWIAAATERPRSTARNLPCLSSCPTQGRVDDSRRPPAACPDRPCCRRWTREDRRRLVHALGRLAIAGGGHAGLQLCRGDRRWRSTSMRSILGRCSRACVLACSWLARFSTSTAGSAASTFSGPGRQPGLPREGSGQLLTRPPG